MDTTIKFVTGYTKDTLYEKEVENLTESLRYFSLDYEVYPYKSQNDWIKNCAVKAEIVLDALEKYKKKIVWLDADCVVRERPTKFWKIPEEANLAAPRHDWSVFGKKSPVIHYDNGSGWHLVGGTLAFPYSEKTIQLVKEWIALNKAQDKYVDQANLQQIIETNRFSFYPLPLSYFKVNGFRALDDRGVKNVIEHYQASHRYKRELKRLNEGNNIL